MLVGGLLFWSLGPLEVRQPIGKCVSLVMLEATCYLVTVISLGKHEHNCEGVFVLYSL
jgi:hypothetical protein